MAIESNTLRIFVSYSHEDRKWFDKHPVIPRLARALRQDGVEFWWDERIDGGTKWRSEIETEINKADIAILLVSQGFLDSEFIRDFELPRIESRAKEDKLIVIPILISYCDWQSIPLLEELQMLPAGTTPLIEYVADAAKYERVQYELLQAIKKQIKKIRGAGAGEVTVGEKVLTDELTKKKKQKRIGEKLPTDELIKKKKRRRKLIVISILSCLALVLGVILVIILINPPIKGWTKTFGGSSIDGGSSVQQTLDGGYIITGSTQSYGAGSADVWLIKTDANGNHQWDKTFGGGGDDGGWSVQQTSDGGYIITGYSQLSGNYAVWLLKTNANGDTSWTRIIGKSGTSHSVKPTSDGGYIITGNTTFFGAGGADVYLIKIDAYGNQEWHKTFGGSANDGGESVQQTMDGGYIITGTTRSFGAGGADVYLIKTDANGNQQWDTTFGGPADDYGESVQQTTDGGYIITGNTRFFGKGGADVWLIKTDANGGMRWYKPYGGPADDGGESVQQTLDGGYIITGYTQSFGAGNADVWLIKTDANGDTSWTKTFGGSAKDLGSSVQQTTDAGYIITGSTQSYGAGNADVWLIKTDENGNVK